MTPQKRADAPAQNTNDASVWYQHARAGRIDPGKPSQAPRRSGSSTIALQAIAGLLAGVAALYVLSRESSMKTVVPQGPETPAYSTAAAPSSTAASAPASPSPSPLSVCAARPTSETEASLFEALTAGPNSPHGINAGSISPLKALENANANLGATGTARDTDEGGFWLKRYILGTLGDERTVRVLTQLGSVYAEPAAGRSPDHAKARQLWEIASAAGDPVAMCFLGLLHENGLGVAADKKIAQRWYERSKATGGCPAVDDSIARVWQ